MNESITVNGVEYVPASDAVPAGPRAVLVLDRGWVFAGDVTEANGRVVLTNAVQVRSWSSIGFEGMIDDPDSDSVVLKPMPQPVDFPAASELFRVPVGEGWGL